LQKVSFQCLKNEIYVGSPHTFTVLLSSYILARNNLGGNELDRLLWSLLSREALHWYNRLFLAFGFAEHKTVYGPQQSAECHQT